MSSSKYQQYTGVPYKGLWNQGFTCYLNSVLQVLFMTPDFTEALQRSPPGSLDSYLEELFDDLKNYDCNTYKITKALGITDVHVQADAAECFENILRNITNTEASQIFQGVLTVKNKCSKCDTETCDDNPCWSLPLELDSEAQYRVEDGITQYFRPSEVSGLNQLFCEDCNAKTDSTVKLELKQHPEVLMLLLKRFKFNYNYMCYYKVDHRVELPPILEIQNQTYELYAFVEHHGSLKCGKYSANIKSHEDGNWYHFDDSRVNLYYQFFQLDKKETSRSAYLLFYRKISAEEALIEESKKACTPESSETLRGETNEPKKYEETVDSQRSHEKPQSCDSEERQETEESLKKKITSVEKEEDLKDQTMKSLRKEKENFREQMMINLRKEEENLKDQMMMNLRIEEDQMRMNLKKEEENLKDQMRMNWMKEQENFRGQMRMNLRKEEDLKDQMMKSLRKEVEELKDQMRINLRKEVEELKKEMMVNLKKEEEDLKDQMRMRAEKQKEENMPEHQTKASKPLTYYDLYKNPLQSSGDESRVRSSERSQELEGENRRRSTQHEQQSENKSTENIYTGSPTGSSVNMETVEVQRGDFRADRVYSSNISALGKGFESLSNEACDQRSDGTLTKTEALDSGRGEGTMKKGKKGKNRFKKSSSSKWSCVVTHL